MGVKLLDFTVARLLPVRHVLIKILNKQFRPAASLVTSSALLLTVAVPAVALPAQAKPLPRVGPPPAPAAPAAAPAAQTAPAGCLTFSCF